MGSTSDPRSEGARAVALRSQTTSTKWVYQTVAVQGGAYYAAAMQAIAGPEAESVFVRISWYGSADGSGQAISSADSLEADTASGQGFSLLATGPVQAPPGAQSAKVRLMLRPLSESPAVAYFDAVTFFTSQASGDNAVSAAGGAASTAHRAGSRPGAGAQSAEDVVSGPADSGSGPATPVALANVKTPKREEPQQSAAAGGGGKDWAVVLAVSIAMAAVALGGRYELWQRRGRPASGDGD